MKFLLIVGALVGVRSDTCSDWETDATMYNTTSCQGVTCCTGLTMRGIAADSLQCVSEVVGPPPYRTAGDVLPAMSPVPSPVRPV